MVSLEFCGQDGAFAELVAAMAAFLSVPVVLVAVEWLTIVEKTGAVSPSLL